MKTLGVIVARAGSKGIPRKNLTPFLGKPLIWWTAHAAAQSRLDGVAISTDCEECWESVREFGVEIPCLRPAELAGDESKSIDVLRHMVSQCRAFDAVFCLQPTNPLRTVEDIDGAIRLMERTGCDSVIGYTPAGERHPSRMATIVDGSPLPFSDGGQWDRRQDLQELYLRCGNVYLTRTEWIKHGSLTGHVCRAWIVPPERAWNIDTPLDVVIAEALAKHAC